MHTMLLKTKHIQGTQWGLYCTFWPCWHVLSPPELSRYERKRESICKCHTFKNSQLDAIDSSQKHQSIYHVTLPGWGQSTVWASRGCFHLLGFRWELGNITSNEEVLLWWKLPVTWKPGSNLRKQKEPPQPELERVQKTEAEFSCFHNHGKLSILLSLVTQ